MFEIEISTEYSADDVKFFRRERISLTFEHYSQKWA